MVEQKIIRAIQGIQPQVTFMVANQNSPIPEHVFCEVYTIGDYIEGTPTYENDEFQETITTVVRHRVSLSYNGLVTSNAHNYAKQMTRYLESFQARLSLKEQGFSLIRVHDIQKIPLIKDVDMYLKYVLDFTVVTEESDSFGIDVIDRAIIHGDFEFISKDFEVDI